MKNEKLYELLKKNGLSERESKVYLTLLENPNITPTQIHNLVGITRTKIYEILPSLLSKNLIAEELVGKKKAYRILNPESSFSAFVSCKEKELASFKEVNKRLITLTSEIYKQTESNDSPFYKLEHLSDPINIRRRLQYYVQNAQEELLIFLKPPYISISGEFDSELNDSVNIRTIWEYSANPKFQDMLRQMEVPFPDDVRFIDELPIKLFIIDSRITVLALGDSSSKIGEINTIFLDEPIIALFMKEIFESRWKKGITQEEYKKIQF